MSDETTNEASSDAATAAADLSARRKRKRKVFLRLLLIIVIVGIVGWTAWYLLEGRWYVETEDAYVGGNVVQISAKVPGTVISIGADNGDKVAVGQVLVRLDPSDTEVALQAAKARLAQSVRQVRGLYNNVEAAKAEMAAERTVLKKAKSDYDRRRGLAKSGAISAELLAHARDALASARSALIAAKQKQQSAEALVAGTDIPDNPTVKAAEAALRSAYLNHVHTTMIAPVAGYVAKRTVQLGEHVGPGKPLMAVVPLDAVWVDANFKETQLEHMRIGQPVELESDLYGSSVTYHGTVESLGIGTGSAFSLLPAQNATGNWIKIVQRVPVRIRLDPDELKAHPLRIGLSMTVTVDLHDTSGLMLPASSPAKPVLTTDVYKRQLAAAQSMIDKIVAANMGKDGK